MLGKRGFTLIELLVVVAIISLLAAIAVPRVIDKMRRARMTKAEADIRSIETSLEMFAVDAGGPLATAFNLTRLRLELGALGYTADYLYNISLTPILSRVLMSTVEYAPDGPWGPLFKPGVYENLSKAYMNKGIPRDPWGQEYQIYIPPIAIDPRWEKGWAQQNFCSYRGTDTPEPAPPRLDYYIYSFGENRSSDNVRVGTGDGYDDINNWDVDRGWAIAYR